MFSHITLGTNDWEKAKPFWSAVMAALDIPVFLEGAGGIAYGTAVGPKTFIGPTYDGLPATNGNGSHIAFLAKDRASVDAFYAAAIENGGTDEGEPGLRHYHPNYYGAYVRDPDGNKLQAVCHSSKG